MTAERSCDIELFGRKLYFEIAERKPMPKMKTKKSAAKRFSFTGTGKVKYKKQNLRHILTKKSTKRKRGLRHAGILSQDNVPVIRKQLLPYG
jgi:large subunit ribosomal protein L35